MYPTTYLGDCIEVMKENILDNSVDMVLCDMPYGTTRNKWDSSIIDLDKLWKEYHRIIKENGAIVLFAQTPFDKILGASNLSELRYEWIWEKPNITGFLNAKKMPLKKHENILVFYKKLPTYNPQMTQGKPYSCKAGRRTSNYGSHVSTVSESLDGARYPVDILRFNYDKEKFHPTQKPVALLEYMVKTYTNEGDTVLDNCMGSGSTGIACINTGRKFIGIEIEKEYFDIANNRINSIFSVN